MPPGRVSSRRLATDRHRFPHAVARSRGRCPAWNRDRLRRLPRIAGRSSHRGDRHRRASRRAARGDSRSRPARRPCARHSRTEAAWRQFRASPRNCRTLPAGGHHANGQSEHALRPVDSRVPRPARARRAGHSGASHHRDAGHSTLDALAATTRVGDAPNHEHPSSRCVPFSVRQSRTGLCQRASGPADGPKISARGRHLPLHPRIRQRPAGRGLGRRVGRAFGRRGRERHRHSLAHRRNRRLGPRDDWLARLSKAHTQHPRVEQSASSGPLDSSDLERSLVSRRVRRPDGRAALRPGGRPRARVERRGQLAHNGSRRRLLHLGARSGPSLRPKFSRPLRAERSCVLARTKPRDQAPATASPAGTAIGSTAGSRSDSSYQSFRRRMSAATVRDAAKSTSPSAAQIAGTI